MSVASVAKPQVGPFARTPDDCRIFRAKTKSRLSTVNRCSWILGNLVCVVLGCEGEEMLDKEMTCPFLC